MKWLFFTLLGLNLIVFAGMIAGKMAKQYAPVAQVQQPQQPTIIIQPSQLGQANVDGHLLTASGVATPASNVSDAGNKTTATAPTTNVTPKQNNTTRNTTQQNTRNNRETAQTRTVQPRSVITNADVDRQNASRSESGTSRAKYKECSASVSIPEDDYHRIKGLLARYPHAASRQVVNSGGESTARMNVLFMQVSDQEASAIQGVVGRYGQLNRAACNR